MFRTFPLSIIRSFSLHTAMVYFLKFIFGIKLYTFRTVPLSIIRSFSQYTQQHVYDIHRCCVYSEKTPDDRQRNCPKHVEFYSKNKFQKLVHLVGFIIRIYHDARSPERQMLSPSSTYFTPLLATTSLKLISSLSAVRPFPYYVCTVLKQAHP